MNPGKREREARKRHRRALLWQGAEVVPLKLGRKHLHRSLLSVLAVADSRKVADERRCYVPTRRRSSLGS